jgi:hypothetical protein
VLFNIAEIATLETKIPTSIAVDNIEKIKKKILDSEGIDILITEDYSIIEELRDMGMINLSFVGEVFYDRLTYIPLQSLTNSRKPLIFFKTQNLDKEIFDNEGSQFPSISINSSNICKKIHSMIELYSERYETIIIRESIARKCDLPFQTSFDNLYSLYYIAVINGTNFVNSRKIANFFINSPKSKAMIRKNGYRN